MFLNKEVFNKGTKNAKIIYLRTFQVNNDL